MKPEDMGTTGLVEFSLRGIRFFWPHGGRLGENFSIAQDIIASRYPNPNAKSDPYARDSEAVYLFREAVCRRFYLYRARVRAWRQKAEGVA